MQNHTPPPISLNKLKYLKYKKKYLRLKNLQYGGGWFKDTINGLSRGLLYLTTVVAGIVLSAAAGVATVGIGIIPGLYYTYKFTKEFIYDDATMGLVFKDDSGHIAESEQIAGASFSSNTSFSLTKSKSYINDVFKTSNITENNIKLNMNSLINKLLNDIKDSPQLIKLKTEINKLLSNIDIVETNKSHITTEYITTLNMIFSKLEKVINIKNIQIRNIIKVLVSEINSTKLPNIIKHKKQLLLYLNEYFIKTCINIISVPTLEIIPLSNVKQTDVKQTDVKQISDNKEKLKTLIKQLEFIKENKYIKY